MNYLGDWGKQFGILAVGYLKYGSEEKLESDAIMHLYDVYVKIWKDGEEDPTVHDKAREFFKGMEDGKFDLFHRELHLSKSVGTDIDS